MKTSRLPFMVVVLFGATLACELSAQPPPAATPTPTPKPTSTPKIGGRVFGVECQPAAADMLHGETQGIGLVDVEGLGKVTGFRIGDIAGTAGDVGASEVEVSQKPAPNAAGWSTIPGTIEFKSLKVDGPPRTESYIFPVILGGSQEAEISGGNIWCQMNVKHTVPPTPTATPTPKPTPSPTPEPPFIITDDGFRIIYSGPLQVQIGARLEATFQIITPEGLPAKGTLAASLGDPPSDRKASHASGELDTEGKVTLSFDVNWPAGTTKLYVSHGGKVYEVTEITVNP